jgi:hypothetical protein
MKRAPHLMNDLHQEESFYYIVVHFWSDVTHKKQAVEMRNLCIGFEQN